MDSSMHQNISLDLKTGIKSVSKRLGRSFSGLCGILNTLKMIEGSVMIANDFGVADLHWNSSYKNVCVVRVLTIPDQLQSLPIANC